MLTSMESGYVLVLNSTNMADMIGLYVCGRLWSGECWVINSEMDGN